MRLLVYLSISSLTALPILPLIQSGNAEFQMESDAHLKITVSDQAIVDWQEFSIAIGESVSVDQPSQESLFLSRVISATPSRLLGSLKANGKLILVNPNGILVGKEARIDTGSLIASTLDIHTRDFDFSGDSSAPFSNLGCIMATGEIRICSRSFENEGTMIAPQIDIQKFDECIIRGSLFAQGGMVRISGGKIALMEGAVIDASGKSGGGSVFVGGGLGGKDLSIPNAKRVFIDPAAQISASALEKGDGGTIVLWSDEGTKFYGSLVAEGGPLGGNGGFLEISSPKGLDFSGHVSTKAPAGAFGTILLDPFGLTISNVDVNVSGASPFAPTGAGATLNSATLQAALSTGSVIVQTGAPSDPPPGAADIDWQDGANVSWSAATNLTVLATNNLIVSANVTNTSPAGFGYITFVSGWDGVTTAGFGPGTFGVNNNGFGADLDIGPTAAATQSISSANGQVRLFGGDVSVTAIANGAVIVTATALGISVEATGTYFQQAGPLNFFSHARLTSDGGPGPITIRAAGDISFAGNPAISSNNGLTEAVAGGPLTVTSTGGSIFVVSGNPFADANLRTTGNRTALRLNAAGTIEIGGVYTGVGYGDSQVEVTTDNGPIFFTAGNNIFVRTGEGTGGGDSATVEAQGALGQINFTAANRILVATPQISTNTSLATVLSTGPITLTSLNGPDITLLGSRDANSSDATVQSTGGSITFNSAGSIFLIAGGQVAGDVAQQSDARVITGGGDITFNGTGPLGSQIVLDGGGINDVASIFSTSGNIFINAPGYDVSLLGGRSTNATASIVTGGNITIDPVRSLTLTGGTGSGAAVFISTLTGLTQVVTTANAVLQAGSNLFTTALIGASTAGATATGNIFADIGGTLLIQGGTGVFTPAQIGHMMITSASNPETGSATGNINVIVRNSGGQPFACQLLGGTNNAAITAGSAHIGHGSQRTNSTLISGTLTATIVNGSVLMRGGVRDAYAHIGMGGRRENSTSGVVQSDATVTLLNGNLIVSPPIGVNPNTHAGVFHFAPTVSGSVTVRTSGSVQLYGRNATSQAVIGAFGDAIAGCNFACSVNVCAGLDILLGGTDPTTGAGAGACGIGQSTFITFGASPIASASQNVSALAARNILMAPNAGALGAGKSVCFIGSPNALTLGAGPFTSQTFAVATNDISLFGDVTAPAPVATESTEIYGLAGTNVAVGRNVFCKGGFRDARISSRLQAPLSETRIRAFGGIRFQNSISGGLGRLGSTPLAGQGGSVEARAAGDVILASDTIQSAPLAYIFVEGGSLFGTGALMTSSGGSLTSVNQIPTSSTCVPPGFSPSSSANMFDGRGAVRFDTARYTAAGGFSAPPSPLLLQTIDGDITVFSEDIYETTDLNYPGVNSGAFANLTCGNGPNELILTSTGVGDIHVRSYHDTSIENTVSTVGGNIAIITENDMELEPGSLVTAGQNVILVVDNQEPLPPFIGPGGYTMTGTAGIVSGSNIIRIFTALPSQNTINCTFNGQSLNTILAQLGLPFPGQFLTNSLLEFYCTYYNVPFVGIFIGNFFNGTPFTVFYKPCLQILTAQAMIIVDELLSQFHPFNEFPGWMVRFFVHYDEKLGRVDEPYYFRRRNLNVFNHPKSYTVWLNDEMAHSVKFR